MLAGELRANADMRVSCESVLCGENEVKYARGGDENAEDDDEGYTEEG